jgi:ABC-2 type transport system ATP-binding protein
VLDHGRVAAQGTPEELKARVGGERLEVVLTAADDLGPAADALTEFATGAASADPARPAVTVPVRPGTRLLETMRALDAADVDAVDVHRREATLDDVFLSLTDTGVPA